MFGFRKVAKNKLDVDFGRENGLGLCPVYKAKEVPSIIGVGTSEDSNQDGELSGCVVESKCGDSVI